MQIIVFANLKSFPNLKTLRNMPLFRTIESKAKVVYVKRGHILKMATLRIFSGYKRKKSIVWEHVHVSSFLKHVRYKSNYGTETTELFKFLKVRVTFF